MVLNSPQLEDWAVAHGKHRGLRADPPSKTEEWRALKDAADRECAEAMKPVLQVLKPYNKTWIEATDWSRWALRARAEATGKYVEHHDCG